LHSWERRFGARPFDFNVEQKVGSQDRSLWKTLIDELTVVLIAALPLIELKVQYPLVWLADCLSRFPFGFPILVRAYLQSHFVDFASDFALFESYPTLTPIAGCWSEIAEASPPNRPIGIFGLFLFVAIPLPGTGVWTGSGLSAILKMKFWPSVIAIFAGNLVAGFIIAALSWGISLV
jgi:hypothetical protein